MPITSQDVVKPLVISSIEQMYLQMKESTIKISYLKVLKKDIALWKVIRDRYLNFNVSRPCNYRKLIKRVRILRLFSEMLPLCLLLVFLGIAFDILHKTNEFKFIQYS